MCGTSGVSSPTSRPKAASSQDMKECSADCEPVVIQIVCVSFAPEGVSEGHTRAACCRDRNGLWKGAASAGPLRSANDTGFSPTLNIQILRVATQFDPQRDTT